MKNFKFLRLTMLLITITHCFAFDDASVDAKKLKHVWNKIQSNHQIQYYELTINGVHLEGERLWDARWHLIKDCFPYKGKRILELGSNLGLASIFIKKYKNPLQVTAVDHNRKIINCNVLAQEAFGVNFPVYVLDFNKDNYEDVLGYDYDLVICFSLYRWVKEKSRLLAYLQNFRAVLYEGHEPVEETTTRFKKLGFAYHKVIGKTDRSLPAPNPKGELRSILLFSKTKI